MTLGKRLLLVFLLAFAGIQVVTCERTNPPVDADIRVSDDVKSVLRRACYDCHSNETRWPWYSRVAPVSWMLHQDVVEGRAELNFSHWESLSPERRSKLRRKSGEEVADGEMPPWYYRVAHPDAALSRSDEALLREWALSAGGPKE